MGKEFCLSIDVCSIAPGFFLQGARPQDCVAKTSSSEPVTRLDVGLGARPRPLGFNVGGYLGLNGLGIHLHRGAVLDEQRLGLLLVQHLQVLLAGKEGRRVGGEFSRTVGKLES